MPLKSYTLIRGTVGVSVATCALLTACFRRPPARESLSDYLAQTYFKVSALRSNDVPEHVSLVALKYGQPVDAVEAISKVCTDRLYEPALFARTSNEVHRWFTDVAQFSMAERVTNQARLHGLPVSVVASIAIDLLAAKSR